MNSNLEGVNGVDGGVDVGEQTLLGRNELVVAGVEHLDPVGRGGHHLVGAHRHQKDAQQFADHFAQK